MLPAGSSKEGEEPENVLGWNFRMKIAQGTAAGLAYLHEECE